MAGLSQKECRDRTDSLGLIARELRITPRKFNPNPAIGFKTGRTWFLWALKKAAPCGTAFFGSGLLLVFKRLRGFRSRSSNLLSYLGTSLGSQAFGFESLGSRRVPIRRRLGSGLLHLLVRWPTLRS